MNIYYFGCWDRAGHFLHHPGGKSVRDGEHATPWGYKLDGRLCPGRHGPKAWQTPPRQPEGVATLSNRNGWTALSFWDRSVDTRMGCNSNFIAEGDFTYDEMVELAKQHFPEIWARFKFKIRTFGQCEHPDCRAVSQQVNHGYCPDCQAILDVTDPFVTVEPP